MNVKILSLLFVVFSSVGCTLPPFPSRSFADLNQKGAPLKRIAILPPTIDVFEVNAAGTIQWINPGERDEIDNWSRAAERTLVAAIKNELEDRSGIIVSTVPKNSLVGNSKSNLVETYHLFDAVTASVMLHSYGVASPGPSSYWREVFDQKIEKFDYSLGEEVRGINIGEKDVLLLIRLNRELWTAGRRALRTTLGVLALAGAAGGLAATGTSIAADVTAGCFACVPMGRAITYGSLASHASEIGGRGGLAATTPEADFYFVWPGISVALVDANSGSILWYNKAYDPVFRRFMDYELADPVRTVSLVKRLFHDLPLGK